MMTDDAIIPTELRHGPLRRRLATPFFRRTRAPAATKRESGQPDSLP